ncbi:MAG: hypothetical protein ACOC9J_03050 [Persicimonas sp.]
MLARLSSRRAPTGALRWPQWAALVFAIVVSVATSPPVTMTTSSFPSWEISERTVVCLAGMEVRPWFAKSGEVGAGLVLRFDVVDGQPREIAVGRAQLQLSEHDDAGASAKAVVGAEPVSSILVEESRSLYVPFLFDNEDAWNEGLRDATVTIDLRIDDEPAQLEYRAQHRSVPWGERYTRYGHWSEGVSYDYQAWGPDPDAADLERTGPHENREGEYLRRDPALPDEHRVRLDYGRAVRAVFGGLLCAQPVGCECALQGLGAIYSAGVMPAHVWSELVG